MYTLKDFLDWFCSNPGAKPEEIRTRLVWLDSSDRDQICRLSIVYQNTNWEWP